MGAEGGAEARPAISGRTAGRRADMRKCIHSPVPPCVTRLKHRRHPALNYFCGRPTRHGCSGRRAPAIQRRRVCWRHYHAARSAAVGTGAGRWLRRTAFWQHYCLPAGRPRETCWRVGSAVAACGQLARHYAAWFLSAVSPVPASSEPVLMSPADLHCYINACTFCKLILLPVSSG